MGLAVSLVSFSDLPLLLVSLGGRVGGGRG